jgi:hypothetical protein
MAKTVAGRAIPGVVLFFAWLVLIVLALILLAWIVHLAGGGMLDLRLGHFRLDVGVA